MLFEADYAKNYASIMYQRLKALHWEKTSEKALGEKVNAHLP